MWKRVDDLIARERIDLGTATASTNVHRGQITLAQIEKVTGAKMKERKFDTIDKTGAMFNWSDAKEPAEICIVYLDSPSKAREWAVYLLLSVEDGRTREGKNIQISDPPIGDLSFRPKRWDRDPHGFDTRNTDKTLCIFTRGSTVVGVNSRRNLEPVIPVIDIARKIDALLAHCEKANERDQQARDPKSAQ